MFNPNQRDYFLWVWHVVLPFLFAGEAHSSSIPDRRQFTVGDSTHWLWGARFRQVRVFHTACKPCVHTANSQGDTALCELYHGEGGAGVSMCLPPFSDSFEATSKHAYGQCDEPQDGQSGSEPKCLYEWEQAQVLQVRWFVKLVVPCTCLNSSRRTWQ
jgi:hypothetical protein